jgi:hypothetical protein
VVFQGATIMARVVFTARVAMAIGTMGVLACAAGADVPAAWTFRIVASEDRATFPGFGIPLGASLSGVAPALDEDGSAVMRWTGPVAGGNGLAVFDAATGMTGVIVTDGDDDTTTDFRMRNRRIALRWFDSTIRVYGVNGTELFRYTPEGGPLGPWSSPGRFTLTDSGAIGLVAALAGTRSLIVDDMTGPTRQQTLVAQQTGAITFLAAQGMNQNRQFGGPAQEGSVFTAKRFHAGDAPVTVFSSAVSAGYNTMANQSDINDAGDVVFFVRRVDATSPDGVTWELRKGTGANASVLVIDDNNPELVATDFINFNPDIANNGLVALRAKSSLGTGIFVTDGTTTRRVAGANDTIETNLGVVTLKADVTSFPAISGGVAQNERNQLAFTADLTTGNTVVIVATPKCRADFDGSGVLAVQDIFDFLNAWFAGDIRTDFDGSGALAVQDIFDFLNAWFAGC